MWKMCKKFGKEKQFFVMKEKVCCLSLLFFFSNIIIILCFKNLKLCFSFSYLQVRLNLNVYRFYYLEYVSNFDLLC